MTEGGDVLKARLRRLHNMLDELRSFAGPESVGLPFGEGLGLEAAMKAALVHLDDPADARACGSMVALYIIVGNTKAEGIPEALGPVMGADDASAVRFDLSPNDRAKVQNLSAGAQEILGQSDGPGSMWDLGLQRDDVATEILCWHSIARLRLATTGRLPELRRP